MSNYFVNPNINKSRRILKFLVSLSILGRAFIIVGGLFLLFFFLSYENYGNTFLARVSLNWAICTLIYFVSIFFYKYHYSLRNYSFQTPKDWLLDPLEIPVKFVLKNKMTFLINKQTFSFKSMTYKNKVFSLMFMILFIALFFSLYPIFFISNAFQEFFPIILIMLLGVIFAISFFLINFYLYRNDLNWKFEKDQFGSINFIINSNQRNSIQLNADKLIFSSIEINKNPINYIAYNFGIHQNFTNSSDYFSLNITLPRFVYNSDEGNQNLCLFAHPSRDLIEILQDVFVVWLRF